MRKHSFLSMLTFALVVLFAFLSNIHAETIKLNDKIYFLDEYDLGNIYMYIFQDGGSSAWSWGDEQGRMTDSGKRINGHVLYEYTITNPYYADYHDSVIFTSNWQNDTNQTINLGYIGSDLIFKPSIEKNGKRDGEWYIYDKSTLKSKIDDVKKLDKNKYTASSWQALDNILNSKIYNYPQPSDGRPYKCEFSGAKDVYNTDLILVTYLNFVADSVYYDALEDITNALNNLEKKNQLFINKNISGGNIQIVNNYFENNENISFKVNPLTGYYVSSIKITKILGYQDDEPILSTDSNDIVDIAVNDSNNYTYTTDSDDIYISASFEKKVYNITSTIEKVGSIAPLTPISVKHGENKEFTIIANEGYRIKSILVNGKEYQLENGKLKLNNISSDTEIIVSFELVDYTVTIDGIDYKLTYGSTIDNLSNYNELITKNGYSFDGFFVNGSNKQFDVKTSIKNNIILETKFTKMKNDSKNPKTGDNIINNFILIGISIIGMISFFIINYKKEFNK